MVSVPVINGLLLICPPRRDGRLSWDGGSRLKVMSVEMTSKNNESLGKVFQSLGVGQRYWDMDSAG